MVILYGSRAHAHFRIERLLSRVSYLLPHISVLQAEYIYFLDINGELSHQELEILHSLVGSKQKNEEVSAGKEMIIVVMPQNGMELLWNRNALEILHHCTLNKIKRIERGIIYKIHSTENIILEDRESIANIFYDQKKQTVFFDLKNVIRNFEQSPALLPKEIRKKQDKILKAQWVIDDELKEESLFSLIKQNNDANRRGILFIDDNKAVIRGGCAIYYEKNPDTLEQIPQVFGRECEIILNASDVSCNPPRFQMAGVYSPSLLIPSFIQSFEKIYENKEKSHSLENLFQTNRSMQEINNETGCPTLLGFFRTLYKDILNIPVVTTTQLRYIKEQEWITPKCEQSLNQILCSNHNIKHLSELSLETIDVSEAAFRILHLPAVADKSFLITNNDRTATGQVIRDPLVGPWQVAVADCAVIVRDFDGTEGEAMAVGERPLFSLINMKASARMSVGESITNIAAACIGVLSDVRLAVNWMVSAIDKADLYDAVYTVVKELCSNLHLAIPLVKLSCEPDNPKLFSTVVSSIAPVMDVRRSLTPTLLRNHTESQIIFIDLGLGLNRLGGSALAQVYDQLGDHCPDIEDHSLLKSFFASIQQLNLEDKILAYHDRSDGGLFVTLCEMAFAGHVGLQIDISALGEDPIAILFNEELGACLQVETSEVDSILLHLNDAGLKHCYSIGTLDDSDQITIIHNEEVVFSNPRVTLQKAWSETSYHCKTIRDNPRTAKKEFEFLNDSGDPGLNAVLTFNLKDDVSVPYLKGKIKPKVVILREQGITGHIEMTAAFQHVGFSTLDVHINDLDSGKIDLDHAVGLAIPGGYSFKDVFFAGVGSAKRILMNPKLRDELEKFFHRKETFTLGCGNGCQILSYLKSLIPGADHWPHFLPNYSEQFEGRLCLVAVEHSPSILLNGMEGSIIPIPVAHREGRTAFVDENEQEFALKHHLITLHYVDNRGRKTNIYPANPNGSPHGITGLTTMDGRVNIMMPHPERAFRTVQYSWHPKEWGEEGPWLRLFRNARKWVG